MGFVYVCILSFSILPVLRIPYLLGIPELAKIITSNLEYTRLPLLSFYYHPPGLDKAKEKNKQHVQTSIING
ncbi:uncharacterized protein GGS25DRAFT_168819 [Hypoxylon fragiforme]|uniref:uncharacterized protein n=1 Tax=Hypoxylon fragiforme TaxID=63214 RepID=UPI0020C5CBD0|nr:uncharacterized protein GGS25DRAFT_168819 [Hypoxylon fragiforme]KAI2610833.1 hypothetical protein GGS25DRAFT_168819 [Hypoxylon fragiforme]